MCRELTTAILYARLLVVAFLLFRAPVDAKSHEPVQT